MSYYCKSVKCVKLDSCARYRAWKYYCRQHDVNVVEGFASGIWFVNESECIGNDFDDFVK